MSVSPFMPKYLLCRPEAGLNDMLCQISVCIDYCIHHGRVLVIDTGFTDVFASPFRDYFSFEIERLTVRLDAEKFLEFAEAHQLTIYPPLVKLRYGAGRPYYVEEVRNYCIDGIVLNFDFNRAYEEDILLHHQCGGGQPSDRLLRGLRLSPRLAARFNKRWSALPKPYVGIHIRDTDKTSSDETVRPVLAGHRGTIFLATDSVAAQQRARELRTEGLFMSGIPDRGGSPIHHHPSSPVEKKALNTTAVIDLLILALAQAVHVSTRDSGYSRLALRLNAKQSLVLRWFSGAGCLLRRRLRLHWDRNRRHR
jgi:hypothetical protein